jgi:hypothetical protein
LKAGNLPGLSDHFQNFGKVGLSSMRRIDPKNVYAMLYQFSQ